MANIQSAKKRIKTSQRNRLQNKQYTSTIKTLTKKYLLYLKDLDDAGYKPTLADANAFMKNRKKRSNLPPETRAKLDEFATPSDTLEEVFENQEQTEISRFYERLPKPTLIAIQELMDEEIYMREKVQEDEISLDDQDLTILEEEGSVETADESTNLDGAKKEEN